MIRRLPALSRRARGLWLALAVVLGAAGALGFTAVRAGYLDSDPLFDFAASGAARPVAALYFSGDMGLRWGMGPVTAKALAAHGIPVLGVSSPALFARHRSAAEVDAIVAGAVRQALARYPGDRLVLIGQSFGADVMQTGLADLPAALRGRVASVVLVVPGRAVWFRADALGLAYKAAPDGQAATTLPRIDWAPITCIYGALESDSACPSIRNRRAWVVRMPGGHFLANDTGALIDTVLSAIRRDVPAAFTTA